MITLIFVVIVIVIVVVVVVFVVAERTRFIQQSIFTLSWLDRPSVSSLVIIYAFFPYWPTRSLYFCHPLYQHNTDTLMTVLKIVGTNNEDIGMINWFAVHPTSMNNTNHLVSGDHKVRQ